MRYTERHGGVAVIKDKTKHKEAMERLAKFEECAGLHNTICKEYCRYPRELKGDDLINICHICDMSQLFEVLQEVGKEKCAKKGYVLMDIPDTCFECPMMNSSDECIMQDEDTNAFYHDDYDELRNGCPIHKVPDKMKICGKYPQEGPVPSYRIGWNDCIDQITGGEDKWKNQK